MHLLPRTETALRILSFSENLKARVAPYRHITGNLVSTNTTMLMRLCLVVLLVLLPGLHGAILSNRPASLSSDAGGTGVAQLRRLQTAHATASDASIMGNLIGSEWIENAGKHRLQGHHHVRRHVLSSEGQDQPRTPRLAALSEGHVGHENVASEAAQSMLHHSRSVLTTAQKLGASAGGAAAANKVIIPKPKSDDEDDEGVGIPNFDSEAHDAALDGDSGPSSDSSRDLYVNCINSHQPSVNVTTWETAMAGRTEGMQNCGQNCGMPPGRTCCCA